MHPKTVTLKINNSQKIELKHTQTNNRKNNIKEHNVFCHDYHKSIIKIPHVC